jgi:mRNA interferase MazF
MRRGQFVTIVQQGDYGKPRPALIVQSDSFSDLPSVVVCPLTSHTQSGVDEVRIDVFPSAGNGVREHSQICIDKIAPIPTSKIGKVVGEADAALMERVTLKLAVLLAIGEPSLSRS